MSWPIPKPRPIFIVRFPAKRYKNVDIHEVIKNSLSEKLKDEYHVLFTIDELSDNTTFEMYNSTEEDQVKIEELKQRLELMMESATNLMR